MRYIKGIIIICFISLLGIFIGTYIYNASLLENNDVTKKINVKLLQYGVYSSEENMKENANNLSDYFYFKDSDGYHVIIGIVENIKNIKKIEESYDLKDNIYIKEVEVSNMEFIENLRQYDKLLNSLKEKEDIINAEKQILSKYEELILYNE